jgi:hypothetical protein
MRDDDVRESFRWAERRRGGSIEALQGKTNDQACRYVREEYLFSRRIVRLKEWILAPGFFSYDLPICLFVELSQSCALHRNSSVVAQLRCTSRAVNIEHNSTSSWNWEIRVGLYQCAVSVYSAGRNPIRIFSWNRKSRIKDVWKSLRSISR